MASAENWSVEKVVEYIGRLGLHHLAPQFTKNVVDGKQLLDLTEEDLREDLEMSNQDEINQLLKVIASLKQSGNPTPVPASVAATPVPTSTLASAPPSISFSSVFAPTSSSAAAGLGYNFQLPAKLSAPSSPLTWVCTVEGWILEHETFCSNYDPGDRQRNNGPEPGICCKNLVSGSNYLLKVSKDSNSCCGLTDSITLTNTATNSVVGVLPCSMTKFLGPLIQEQLVRLSGSITSLVHPVGGVPPFELKVEANVDQLVAQKMSPKLYEPIKNLRLLLEGWLGDWVDSSYPDNVDHYLEVLKV